MNVCGALSFGAARTLATWSRVMPVLRLFNLALIGLPLVLSTAALAQKPGGYPQRPVRLLVPYAPGGATDITARLLATKLNEIWGVGVVVDNRSGASGNIALEVAARATPDGYTLLVGNVSTNAINETTFVKTLSIKPSRDLTGVTNLIELPHASAANPSEPCSSLE